jgi:multisubunit Na+/H+ antiporter MnhB subunit
MYDVERITIEVASAIACFILVRFMTKPFRLTRETRYLGLPLGFGFLGVSYAFSALSYSPIFDFTNNGLVQLLVRAFAFLFLAITYYFSKSEKKPKLLWNTTMGMLAAILTILILLTIISPQFSRSDYQSAQIFVRGFSLICLSYIAIHALKSHIEYSDSTTLMIPLGYILLAIGQYSALIWAIDKSFFALFGGLALRLAGLAVFLFVSYRIFHTSEKGNE